MVRTLSKHSLGELFCRSANLEKQQEKKGKLFTWKYQMSSKLVGGHKLSVKILVQVVEIDVFLLHIMEFPCIYCVFILFHLFIIGNVFILGNEYLLEVTKF